MCTCREKWLLQVRKFGKQPLTYSLLLLVSRGTGGCDVLAAGAVDAGDANYSLETLAPDA